MLEKALEISQGVEAAAVKSKELKGIHHSTLSWVLTGDGAPAYIYSRCVRGKHEKNGCKFRNAHRGKYSNACRSKAVASGKPARHQTKKLSSTTEPASPICRPVRDLTV